MQWIRSHPYLASLVGALLLLLTGAIIVGKKGAVQTEEYQPVAWGVIGANLFNPVANKDEQSHPSQENLYTNVKNGPPFYYAPPTVQTVPIQSENDLNFDFAAFLSSLSHKSASSPGKITDESFGMSAYSFIPTGLISTSTSGKRRTPLQERLFSYGNEVGSDIQSYEDQYRGAAQILKDQSEDPTDPGKNATLRALAAAMSNVGSELSDMEEVPSQMKAAHDRLASSYKEMGAKLSRIPDATGEKAIIAAMLTYDATAETFTKNFVTLATLFSTYGVSFSPDDPGSIFTFTSSLSL